MNQTFDFVHNQPLPIVSLPFRFVNIEIRRYAAVRESSLTHKKPSGYFIYQQA
jgi:hypothetical protein